MKDLFSPDKPFCIIKRRDDAKVVYLSGTISELDRLEDIPREAGQPAGGQEGFDSLSILPFRQVEELGFIARHNGERIICLSANTQRWLEVDHCLSVLPEEDGMTLQGGGSFSPDDDEYASRVRRIIDDEIGNGEGCNFVVPRRYRARISQFSHSKALSCYRRLLADEYGAYWSFLFYTGAQYFVGATPERHISYRRGVVKMNPISGTLRKAGHTRETLMSALGTFLSDPKEIFELLMVTDEELKMMAGICQQGGQVVGPLLKEMSRLIHSEYVLSGQSDRDVLDVLRRSMFAATVTGSPVENACRVIYRHDTESRRYYGSALALIGRDEDGCDTLDSPITIRMAEIDLAGNVEIGVGGTLVRDSDPSEEVAETHAKAGALLSALGFCCRDHDVSLQLGKDLYSEEVMIALSSRNARLSRFWIENQGCRIKPVETVLGSKRITIVDNEDGFTTMLAHMIRSLGARVGTLRYHEYEMAADDSDLIVLGPGPGDPRDLSNNKIARLTQICQHLLHSQRPVLGICLGHQVLCQTLGLPLLHKQIPLQGVQETIDLWGEPQHVGFYNAFVAKLPSDNRGHNLSYDQCTGEVHAIRNSTFAGLQFHPESILTTNGSKLLREELTRLLA